MSLTKRAFTLLLSTLLALQLTLPELAAASFKDFQNDMVYYRKTSQKNKLSANDRLFILLKLKNKYADSQIDVSSLDKEINYWEAQREGRAPPQNETAEEDQAQRKTEENTALAKLSTIHLKKEGNKLNLVFELDRSVLPQAVRVEDPQQPDSPTLMIDFPKTEERLSKKSKKMDWKEGPLDSLRASNGADKTVRVALTLRGDPSYRVVRSGNRIIVEFSEKKKSPPKKAPPKRSTPTPVPASTDKLGASYKIQPGDILNIQVLPATELSRETIVQPHGAIIFPLLGTVSASGLTVASLEKKIAKELRPFVADPQVTISIKMFSRKNIFITGQIVRAGPLPYSEDLRLLSAISQAGGFNENADRSRVQIYRGSENERQSYEVDAKEILAQGDLSLDFLLEPGDIIEIPRGSNSIYLIGSVKSSGNYKHREGITLLEIISQAGGLKPGAKTKQVRVFRQEGTKRKVIKTNLSRVMEGHINEDMVLEAGDIVHIPEKPIYAKTEAATTLVLPWLSLFALVIALVVAD